MVNTNPLLLTDFYKATHPDQMPKNLKKVVAYYIPRMSRIPKDIEGYDQVPLFGLQGFIKEYLIEGFNTYFFERDKQEVIDEYLHYLTAMSNGINLYNTERIEQLHDLGYLPIQISAVPEGMFTKVGVPQIEISNTEPGFEWLVGTLEIMMSNFLWHCGISAWVGNQYRKITDKYYEKTCLDKGDPWMSLADFSMRGQTSMETAIKASSAWLVSFFCSSTIPASIWLERYYNTNVEEEIVSRGALSTEHSVMCSNYAVDGDEVTFLRKALTELYPTTSFSVVADAYDYENFVEKVVPQIKNEILEHEGYFGIRGDSGDPVEIIAGKKTIYTDKSIIEFSENPNALIREIDEKCKCGFCLIEPKETTVLVYFEPDDKVCKIKYCLRKRVYEETGQFQYDFEFYESNTITFAEKGTVQALWEQFGGTVNEQGYKVLNSHVKAIYGDSITLERCEEIYKRLEAKGFAANNVSLGVGSFSFNALDWKGQLYPYTRDTFGVATKITYAIIEEEDEEGNLVDKDLMIYKKPKGTVWKHSPKGMCFVAKDGQSFSDGYTLKELESLQVEEENLIKPVFIDGMMINDIDLNQIRTQMYYPQMLI